MSHCVISGHLDPDGGHVNICAVHATPDPCPSNGAPAYVDPVEMTDANGRGRAVAMWRFRTHGQRSLTLHHGTFAGDTPHGAGTGCWCAPETVDGVPCGCRD